MIIGVFLSLLFLEFLKKKQSPRVPNYEYKSELAKKYDVDVSTLMRWVELFLPEEYGERWKGTKVKTIDPDVLYQYLEAPEDRPKTKSGNYIYLKSEIAAQLNMSLKTFKRRIDAIEDMESALQMKTEAYSKCNVFPPRYIFLILAYFGSFPDLENFEND